MAGPGSVPGWLQLPCLATLSTVHRSYSTRHPTPAQPCPLINPQGGPSVIGPISTYFPFQLDIKTRQFQPANHFHSLPLPMCRYGIYLYHCTVVAECLDLDTLCFVNNVTFTSPPSKGDHIDGVPSDVKCKMLFTYVNCRIQSFTL